MGTNERLSAQAAGLPGSPGVYLFKDARGRVLYVGKADVLRDRVRSYFGPSLEVRHVRMVERAERVDHVVTGSIAEAYLLENNLIKQHRPRYNIRLKDDKSYPYVKVTLGEDFPRILRTRQLGDRTARYFGPYANAKAVDDSLDLLQKLFPYRTCKLTIVAGEDGRGRTVPPSALPGGRPCLLYHLKRCTAPCVGKDTAEAYRAAIDRSVLFLEGRYGPLARELRSEMGASSARLEFERAAELRDHLRAIERTHERQEVHAYEGEDLDLVVPQRGRKRRLVELATRNAEYALRQERVRWLADRGKTQEALVQLYDALREHLDLEGPPKRIECYDVSHVQGTDG